MPDRRLKIVFCWAEAAPYSAACWRALSERPGVDVHIIHPERLLPRPNPFPATQLLDGLSHQMFDASMPGLDQFLLDAVDAQQPDVLAVSGWIFWPYTRLIAHPAMRRSAVVIGMDTPWRGTLAQRTAKVRLRHFMRHVDLVVTASEAATTYARRIGVAEGKLRSGYYGCGDIPFATAGAQRSSLWPCRFLFAARYAPEKNVATLVAAYARYRDAVTDPWPLTCTGQGPDGRLLEAVPGVSDRGFTDPTDLPRVFAEHGVFVLPSSFEPWGVVLAEAGASGMPVICSAACGAAGDLVRSYYNGVIVPTGDVDALARAMRWMHDHHADLPDMGRRGQTLAAPFAAEAWAARWHNYALDVMAGRTGVV